MHEHNERPESEMRQQRDGASLQKIRRAQAFFIEQLCSSLTSLDAAIHQLEAVQENLPPLKSEEERVRYQVNAYSKLLKDMQRTQVELRERKERLQTQLNTQQTENSDVLLYLGLELQEAEATEHRAVALIQHYEREQEDAKIALSQLEPKKAFLQQQEERVRQSIVTRTDSLRQDFARALATPSAEFLPSTYKQQLTGNLSQVYPQGQPKDILERLKQFRSVLHQDLTPKPPPVERKPPPPRQSREKKENLRAHIRWMIRRDMPEVLQMEQLSFEYAWEEEDFHRCLRQRNCIGMVAEYGQKVVGFMIYELHKSKLHILNFAVHPSFRKRDVGSQMIDKLVSKLSWHRRTRISLELRETNMIAQRFFQLNGFEAKGVLHKFYEDSGEDAYAMEYRFVDSEEGTEEEPEETSVEQEGTWD